MTTSETAKPRQFSGHDWELSVKDCPEGRLTVISCRTCGQGQRITDENMAQFFCPGQIITMPIAEEVSDDK